MKGPAFDDIWMENGSPENISKRRAKDLSI